MSGGRPHVPKNPAHERGDRFATRSAAQSELGDDEQRMSTALLERGTTGGSEIAGPRCSGPVTHPRLSSSTVSDNVPKARGWRVVVVWNPTVKMTGVPLDAALEHALSFANRHERAARRRIVLVTEQPDVRVRYRDQVFRSDALLVERSEETFPPLSRNWFDSRITIRAGMCSSAAAAIRQKNSHARSATARSGS